MSRHVSRHALTLALLLALSGQAAALDVDYEVGVAVKRTDNVALTAADRDPLQETIWSPRLYFHADRDGPRLQMVVRGDLEYLDYVDDTYPDETRARLNGQLDFAVIPDRLDFVAQDYLSEQPVDQFAAFAPDNRQQVNVFVAGPTLHARLGTATRAQLDLRYSDNHAEETKSFDSNRYSAAVRLVRELNRGHTVSANIASTEVEFDLDSDRRDYRRHDGYLNSTRRGAQVDTDLDLGYSRAELGAAGRRESSPLVRASLEWRLSPRSLLGASIRRQFSDTAQDLISPLGLEGLRFNDFSLPYLIDPSIFRERQVRGRYRYRGERFNVELVPYYRRVRYLDNVLDNEDRRGALLAVEYRMRPRLTLSLQGLVENRDFVDIVREDDDTGFSIGLANRFTRHWTGRIDLQHRERDSSVARRSFNSSAVLVSFSYRR